jgi:hypothetical protein
MPTVLRNVLAVIGGIVVGSLVNMALVGLGPSLIPPPAGVDVTTPEGLSRGIHLFEPQHFVVPFLAHALGTLVGALAAYLIAGSRRSTFALLIGCLFLLGGVAAAFMIPAPAWFVALDLILAYLPMAWLATKIGRGIMNRASMPSPGVA